ncbi:MAG: alpha-amylase [Rhodospirillaceae bacterium]|nr:MAG: alpha-amylase [Rhodospirillaceae bacterium]
MERWTERASVCRYDQELELFVDRIGARYAAWYEMFHRSQGTEPGKGSTLRECERRLPEIRDLGFDVIYFVPVHPIGRMHRKGPNNALTSGPGDPGSPYAIGAVEGGHTAINPELGTLEDFRHFVHAAAAHGMEVALDFAIQCAPDHPWIREHPEWFKFRPDGTIKYAENPPKKYQDIVNVDFYNPDAQGLWQALLDVVLFWVAQGVHIFRVDNPHTKPLPFWEWMIREVRRQHPQVIFLAEAFTRPPMMKMLAKVGFSQSYTYFTWRNFKWELTEYLIELTQTEVAEYMRPNFFPNTPDILPEFLQKGGRPAFMIRFVLAATLSSVYGIYNGFELCENTAVPGKEEYLNSEKYDYKVWDWDRPGNIKDLIATVNRARRENPALQELTTLRFHPAHDENILFYSKMTATRANMIFIAVTLDPFDAHECVIEMPLADMGLGEHDNYAVEELISGAKHLWSGAHHRIRLDPHTTPAMILRVIPWHHVDFQSPSW